MFGSASGVAAAPVVAPSARPRRLFTSEIEPAPACASALYLRDTIIAPRFIASLDRYEREGELLADLASIRKEIDGEMRTATEGRLLFAEVAATIKLQADFLNNMLAITPSGVAVERASRVYNALQTIALVQKDNDPVDLATELAFAVVGDAGKAVKPWYDMFVGVRDIADLRPQRNSFIRSANEAYDRIEREMTNASVRRVELAERRRVMQATVEGIDHFLRSDACTH